MNKNQFQDKIIPSNAQTIIIVLGQCLLPSGQPHQWLLERVNFTYSLLDKLKLDLTTTYIIASGSDVSNKEYYINDSKKKHITQAQMMYRLFMKIHEEYLTKNGQKMNQQKIKFQDHLIQERKAMTTIQNFYYSFLMICKSKLKTLKNIIVVTSDFHMKRAKLCFDTMFLKQNKTLIQGIKYQNVKFQQAPIIWTSQYLRKQKFDKQNSLYQLDQLIKQMKKTAMILWDQIKGTNNAMFYHKN